MALSEGRGGNRNIQPIHPAAAASAAAWPPALSATQALRQGPSSSALPSAQPASLALARNTQQVVHSAHSVGMTARPQGQNDHPDLRAAASALQQREGSAAAATQIPPAASFIVPTTQAHGDASMAEAPAPRHWPGSSLSSSQPASQGINQSRPGQQQQQLGRHEASDGHQGRSSHLQPSHDNRAALDPSFQTHVRQQVRASYSL